MCRRGKKDQTSLSSQESLSATWSICKDSLMLKTGYWYVSVSQSPCNHPHRKPNSPGL